MVEQPPKGLLRIEHSAGPQHPVNLNQNAAPVGNVVNDAKVKDGIVGSIRRIYGSGITNPKPDPRPAGTQSLLRDDHHPRVQVERINGGSTKDVQNQLRTNPPAAANLKCPCAGHRATHA